jgi:hypothetical protein
MCFTLFAESIKDRIILGFHQMNAGFQIMRLFQMNLERFLLGLKEGFVDCMSLQLPEGLLDGFLLLLGFVEGYLLC